MKFGAAYTLIASLWLFQSSAIAQTLLIEDAVVINTITLQQAKRDVLIRNDRIVEVAGQVDVADTVNRIDAKGMFLIPGLTDSHVHLGMMPGMGLFNPRGKSQKAQLQRQYYKQLPRNYLYFGVTQVMDLASTQRQAEMFDKHPLHPDQFYCGAVPVVGGYPLVFSSLFTLAAFPYFVAEDPEQVPSHYDPQQHTPEAVVRRIKQDGGRCVKVFIEDGFGPQSHWPMASAALLKRIKVAADKEGLPIYAHANALDMQKIAVELDVDVMAHGLWNWQPYSDQQGLPDPVKALLDKIIAQQIAFQPTARVIAGVRDLFKPNVLDNELLHAVVPADVLAWYHTEQAQGFKQMIRQEDFGNLPDSRIVSLFNKRPVSQGNRVIKYLSDQDYPLLLASDTPANPSYANQHGLNSYLELKAMRQAGARLGAILQSATINNAKVMKVEDDYGSVTAGKFANLLLLKQNPLEQIEAYNSIKYVVLKGQLIERDSLRVK